MSFNIAFRDFVPRDETGFLSFHRKTESLGKVVERVNRWLDQSGVEVIQIETLVLPGSPQKTENPMSHVEVEVANLGFLRWSQAIRVWYRAGIEKSD